MNVTTLAQLAHAADARRFNDATRKWPSFYQSNNTPETNSANLRRLVAQEIRDNPALKTLRVIQQPGMPGGYYPSTNAIQMSVNNPAALAHELGHAKNMMHSSVYKNLVTTANRLANINSTLAVPTMIAMQLLIQDKEKRREALNTASGISAMLMAPGLAEELGASIDALKNAPDKMEAIRTLAPAFLHHVVSAAKPILVYQIGKVMRNS